MYGAGPNATPYLVYEAERVLIAHVCHVNPREVDAWPDWERQSVMLAIDELIAHKIIGVRPHA